MSKKNKAKKTSHPDSERWGQGDLSKISTSGSSEKTPYEHGILNVSEKVEVSA